MPCPAEDILALPPISKHGKICFPARQNEDGRKSSVIPGNKLQQRQYTDTFVLGHGVIQFIRGNSIINFMKKLQH